MKKLIYQFLLFSGIVGLSFLMSCNKDSDPDPVVVTIDVTGDTDTQSTFDPMDTVNFNISYTSDAGISSFIYTLSVDGNEQPEVILNPAVDLGIDLSTDSNAGSFNWGFIIDKSLAGSEIALTLEIVDQEGGVAAENVFFSVTSSPEARSYSTVLLYAPTDTKTNASFFSSTDGMTYSPDDVTSTSASISPKIDFGYYYGVSDLASLASPQGYSTLTNSSLSSQVSGWSVKNTTTLKATDLTNTEFLETTTWADIDAAFDGGTDEGQIITQISEGDVIAFETNSSKDGGSKRGLIYVNKISGTDNSNDYLEIDVLVQEPAN